MAIIYGTKNAEPVNGTFRTDLIYARAGDDVVHGGHGNDWISAGAGNDQVWGDTGNDRLAGDVGNDTFHFSVDSGNDVITDYNESPGEEDSIQLHDGVTVDSYVQGDINGDGQLDTVLYFDPAGEDSVAILNTSYSELFFV
jgi:Ca2+-binding RTX toxin-like protein